MMDNFLVIVICYMEPMTNQNIFLDLIIKKVPHEPSYS